MSDVLLFSAGSVMFVVTTTATLLFGYQRFNALYGPANIAEKKVVTVEDGYEVYAGDAER